MGRIVHDDRGSASVEWHDAPDDYERPVLKIEGTGVNAPPPPLSIKEDNTFNPYDRVRDAGAGGPAARPAAGKRDLKKLSEWIKLMREMEERKKKGEED